MPWSARSVGAGGSPLPSQEGLRHILSAPIPPSCLPSWCPLSFHEHPWSVSIITHSPRHVPELLWIGRACYHLMFLGKIFFFPSFSVSFIYSVLQEEPRLQNQRGWAWTHTLQWPSNFPEVTHTEGDCLGKQSCPAFREHLRHQEVGINLHTPLCLKWLTSKDPLYSRGNSAQCCATTSMGKGFEKRKKKNHFYNYFNLNS